MKRAKLLAPVAMVLLLSPATLLAQDAQPQPETPAEQPAEAPTEPADTPAETTPEATETPEKAEPAQPEPETTTAETDTAANEPEPTKTIPPPTTTIKRADSDVSVGWNEDLEDFQRRYRWKFEIDGYIRTQYTGIQNDPDVEIYGRNDGFFLANARIGFKGEMLKRVGFRLQFDGAVDQQIDRAQRPASEVDTRVRDAYLWWEPTRFTRVSFGQFKPKFDVEELATRDELLFVDRSVGSRGVSENEGPNVEGLSRDREPGIELGMRPYYFNGKDPDEKKGLGVAYALSLTNGAGSNLSRNDNDAFAYYGRAQVHWAEMVRVGGAAYMNSESDDPTGLDPISSDVFGWTADLTVKWAGFTLMGSIIGENKKFDELDVQADVNSTAYHASIGYREPFLGFEPTFRYAFYDPESLDSGNDVDLIEGARTHYTVGLNFTPRYPIRLMVNYTFTQEEEAVELDNDRFDLLFQVTW